MQFPPLSDFAKQVLIGLSVLFAAELILQNWMGVPIIQTLAWNASDSLLNPMTILAIFGNYIIQGNNPMGFLFQLIALFFFLPPTQQHIGRKGIQRLVGRVLLTNAVVGSLGILSGAVVSGTMAFGLNPLITAMIVLFGLRRPDATIYLLIFPVKAAWVAWGSGLFALFSFLTHRSLSELLLISSWLAAFFFTKTGSRMVKRLWKQYGPNGSRSGSAKKRSKLTVHNGGRDDDYIH